MGRPGHHNTYWSRELDGAIRSRNLPLIYACTRELANVGLYSKAQILDVVRTEREDLFDRAAGKFIADYIAERNPGRAEIDELVNWTDPIMFALEPLLERCDPRRRRAT